MKYQSFQENNKWKYQKNNLQEDQIEKINELSKYKKSESQKVIGQSLMSKLQDFPDDQLLNLQQSIPLLNSFGVLRVLTSIMDAKQKINSKDQANSRLKDQAKFVYYLWKMINQEEVEARQIKEIIMILQSNVVKNVVSIFRQMFQSSEDIIEFVQAWRMLNSDKKTQTKERRCYTNNQSYKQIYQQQKFQNSPPFYYLENLRQSHNPLENTNKINKYSYQLSVQKTKQLVGRLYKPQFSKIKEQMKNKMQQARIKQQLNECTFKPQLQKRSLSINHQKPIKGFQKAVGRLRVANEKTKVQKQLRQYTPVGQNYEKLKQKGINPPKFLSRQKQQGQGLFIIQFDIGRHKVKVKIRPQDTEESIATRLCQIYSLKGEYHEQIAMVVRNELQNFYNQQQRDQNNQHNYYD